METIKKYKIYVFLFIGVILLMSSVAMSSGKIRVFDFKYERFEFLNGGVVLELPDNPQRRGLYYKVFVDKHIDLTTGHVPISSISINKYTGPKIEGLGEKLVLKNIIRRGTSYESISRWAIWYGSNPIALIFETRKDTDLLPTEAERDERIKKDDEIFEHIVESFRYRKEDGTYVKPEIIRQKEEVKTLE